MNRKSRYLGALNRLSRALSSCFMAATLLAATVAHAISVNPEELAEVRGWVMAKLESAEQPCPGERAVRSNEPPFSFVYGDKI